eukprot:g10982.t1
MSLLGCSSSCIKFIGDSDHEDEEGEVEFITTDAYRDLITGIAAAAQRGDLRLQDELQDRLSKSVTLSDREVAERKREQLRAAGLRVDASGTGGASDDEEQAGNVFIYGADEARKHAASSAGGGATGVGANWWTKSNFAEGRLAGNSGLTQEAWLLELEKIKQQQLDFAMHVPPKSRSEYLHRRRTAVVLPKATQQRMCEQVAASWQQNTVPILRAELDATSLGALLPTPEAREILGDDLPSEKWGAAHEQNGGAAADVDGQQDEPARLGQKRGRKQKQGRGGKNYKKKTNKTGRAAMTLDPGCKFLCSICSFQELISDGLSWQITERICVPNPASVLPSDPKYGLLGADGGPESETATTRTKEQQQGVETGKIVRATLEQLKTLLHMIFHLPIPPPPVEDLARIKPRDPRCLIIEFMSDAGGSAVPAQRIALRAVAGWAEVAPFPVVTVPGFCQEHSSQTLSKESSRELRERMRPLSLLASASGESSGGPAGHGLAAGPGGGEEDADAKTKQNKGGKKTGGSKQAANKNAQQNKQADQKQQKPTSTTSKLRGAAQAPPQDVAGAGEGGGGVGDKKKAGGGDANKSKNAGRRREREYYAQFSWTVSRLIMFQKRNLLASLRRVLEQLEDNAVELWSRDRLEEFTKLKEGAQDLMMFHKLWSPDKHGEICFAFQDGKVILMRDPELTASDMIAQAFDDLSFLIPHTRPGSDTRWFSIVENARVGVGFMMLQRPFSGFRMGGVHVGGGDYTPQGFAMFGGSSVTDIDWGVLSHAITIMEQAPTALSAGYYGTAKVNRRSINLGDATEYRHNKLHRKFAEVAGSAMAKHLQPKAWEKATGIILANNAAALLHHSSLRLRAILGILRSKGGYCWRFGHLEAHGECVMFRTILKDAQKEQGNSWRGTTALNAMALSSFISKNLSQELQHNINSTLTHLVREEQELKLYIEEAARFRRKEKNWAHRAYLRSQTLTLDTGDDAAPLSNSSFEIPEYTRNKNNRKAVSQWFADAVAVCEELIAERRQAIADLKKKREELGDELQRRMPAKTFWNQIIEGPAPPLIELAMRATYEKDLDFLGPPLTSPVGRFFGRVLSKTKKEREKQRATDPPVLPALSFRNKMYIIAWSLGRPSGWVGFAIGEKLGEVDVLPLVQDPDPDSAAVLYSWDPELLQVSKWNFFWVRMQHSDRNENQSDQQVDKEQVVVSFEFVEAIDRDAYLLKEDRVALEEETGEKVAAPVAPASTGSDGGAALANPTREKPSERIVGGTVRAWINFINAGRYCTAQAYIDSVRMYRKRARLARMQRLARKFTKKKEKDDKLRAAAISKLRRQSAARKKKEVAADTRLRKTSGNVSDSGATLRSGSRSGSVSNLQDDSDAEQNAVALYGEDDDYDYYHDNWFDGQVDLGTLLKPGDPGYGGGERQQESRRAGETRAAVDKNDDEDEEVDHVPKRSRVLGSPAGTASRRTSKKNAALLPGAASSANMEDDEEFLDPVTGLPPREEQERNSRGWRDEELALLAEQEVLIGNAYAEYKAQVARMKANTNCSLGGFDISFRGSTRAFTVTKGMKTAGRTLLAKPIAGTVEGDTILEMHKEKPDTASKWLRSQRHHPQKQRDFRPGKKESAEEFLTLWIACARFIAQRYAKSGRMACLSKVTLAIPAKQRAQQLHKQFETYIKPYVEQAETSKDPTSKRESDQIEELKNLPLTILPVLNVFPVRKNKDA